MDLDRIEPGQMVRLHDGSDDYRGEGEVKSVDESRIRLKNCRNIETGKKEEGNQIFAITNLLSIEIVGGGELNKSTKAAQGPPAEYVPAGTSNRRKMVSETRRKKDNAHLKSLFPIDMKEMLSQVQIRPPPEMPELELQLGKPREIPRPVRCGEHVEGADFRKRYNMEFVKARELCWKDDDTPPPLSACPNKLYVVDRYPSDSYELAVKSLRASNIVGVSLEGQNLGRHGNLGLIAFTTASQLFLFDVVQLGPKVFDDLRYVLEDPSICKVFHDVRQASDLLHHQFKITLTNIYDTMAAHCLFLTTAMYAGFFPANAYAVSALARNYLGISGVSLFFPSFRLSHMKEDTAIWLERPLTPELEAGAVRNCMFLLDLQIFTRKCMTAPFTNAVDCLLKDTRDADDYDAEMKFHKQHTLPPELKRCLPDWTPNVRQADKWGVVEPSKRRVHNSIGQMNPNIIFSRDVIHQNKAN